MLFCNFCDSVLRTLVIDMSEKSFDKEQGDAEGQTAQTGGETDAKEKDCYFWMNGDCAKGDKCPYKHDPAKKNCMASRPICKFYQKGNCEKGKDCPYRHVVCQKLTKNPYCVVI